METKLCRICGKLSEDYVHIFKTEGLKNKIETCLPIIVSPHCLLPDTICAECLENVDNFYSFIKNCLQNIIILEAQYDIMESCLKTKRKHEKGCFVDLTIHKTEKSIQTDLKQPRSGKRNNYSLVNYDLDSDTNSGDETSNGKVYINHKPIKRPETSFSFGTQYFDDAENVLIQEIAERKSLKRKCDTILPVKTKIFRMDTSSRRKSKQPKKLEYRHETYETPSVCSDGGFSTFYSLENSFNNYHLDEYTEEDKQEALKQVEKEISNSLKQICLLCDSQFGSSTLLAAHVYETHGIDMGQVMSTTAESYEKKKKLPNLVKITDLKTKHEYPEENVQQQVENTEEPPTLLPTFVCPLCPAVSTNRTDLFGHFKTKHPKQAALICGLCLHISVAYADLQKHVETCKTQHTISGKYYCKLCCYSDDNVKLLEGHVVVHDFILEVCKKQAKVFDPSDYVEAVSGADVNKSLTCTDCNMSNFASFKEFSAHRRSQHQIFHCDLCNKFYGRNSHLWKHVNRLHKGHPSITCQFCYKTSASKYHLSQHFNKIHTSKPYKLKQNEIITAEEDFMSQKFQAFDFQSVKQSFMRQEMLEREKKDSVGNGGGAGGNGTENSDDTESLTGQRESDEEDSKPPPKEIDTSSDLYTNIITNYTPPQNEGEFKCPKCFKGFHKRTLLKKHKKNCRPRLQKDLLTRCKTCSRIFKDRQSLTKHLINYHSEYGCEICGQKVQSKCEIVSHIRFSHPNCHLFCHCGNILRNKADLMEHKKDHRNSFVCQFCADALPTKIKLKMHILSLHRKILSLSCGICLKLFETQHILRDHVRLVHKGNLTPLMSCTVCGKNYGSKWKTYDHLNKSHGRIFKACKACLEVFDTEADLQAHYNSAHLNTNQNQTKQNANNTAPVVVKKELYESDYEQTNEKNSGSEEVSNDNEQQSDNDEKMEFRGFTDVKVEDTKISLLEKRLLGKKINQLESMEKTSTPKAGSKPVQKLKPDEVQKKPEIKNDKKNFEEDSFTQNSLHNTSSKRTVYVNSNDPSLCEICLKTWPAKKHLWQHYIRCHKTVAATVCGICLKTNENYHILQQHLRETHPTLLHGQGFGSNFICRICGRYHNASSKLKLHMAIHENFDWSILDSQENGAETEEEEDEHTNNGYEEEEKHSETINYESLIEQVECSSESEMEKDSDSEPESEDNESVISENSLESQMLKNMLREKGSVPDEEEVEKLKIESEEIEIKQEYSSSESENSSDSESYSDGVKSGNSSDDDTSAKQTSSSNSNTNDSAVYAAKQEELETAIRSISYNRNDTEEDYCEVQSAVNSIL